MDFGAGRGGSAKQVEKMLSIIGVIWITNRLGKFLKIKGVFWEKSVNYTYQESPDGASLSGAPVFLKRDYKTPLQYAPIISSIFGVF